MKPMTVFPVPPVRAALTHSERAPAWLGITIIAVTLVVMVVLLLANRKKKS